MVEVKKSEIQQEVREVLKASAPNKLSKIDSRTPLGRKRDGLFYTEDALKALVLPSLAVIIHKHGGLTYIGPEQIGAWKNVGNVEDDTWAAIPESNKKEETNP